MVAGELGAVRDAVLLNAAATISAYDVATAADSSALPTSPVERLADGVARAAQAIDDGSARAETRRLDRRGRAALAAA